MDGAAASKPPKSEKKGQQKKEIKRSPSFPATDDIDKMKVHVLLVGDGMFPPITVQIQKLTALENMKGKIAFTCITIYSCFVYFTYCVCYIYF